jgi:hypothetical protein
MRVPIQCCLLAYKSPSLRVVYRKILGLSVAILLSLTCLAAADDAPAPAPQTSPLAPKVFPMTPEARQALSRQIHEALERTRDVKVVYQDVLGEGPGAWDPDPRYPTDTVNCITWLQLLIAETYGSDADAKLKILDRVRYFDGHVGFGFRKHYTDQWMDLDPLPLRKVDFSSCAGPVISKLHLDLEPAKFQKNIQYECPLYHMNRTSLDLDVVPAPALVQCTRFLPPGYFVMFPVASERYLQKYGGFSGPMGQVHAVVVEIPSRPADRTEPDDPTQFKVYHASITSGKVVETELGSYVLNMWNLYRGYLVYELVPDWDWRTTPPLDPEGEAIAACEAKLKGKVGKLFEHEVQSTSQPKPATKH